MTVADVLRFISYGSLVLLAIVHLSALVVGWVITHKGKYHDT